MPTPVPDRPDAAVRSPDEPDASVVKAALARLHLYESSIARLNDIVIVTEASPIDEPGPRILFVNAAFTRVLGYAAEEVIGRSPRFLQGRDTSRDALDRIRDALTQKRQVRVELVNYAKSGERVVLELDISPVFDAAGRCTHFVSVERDITERQLAEEALRLSEERFRLLSRATTDAVWDLDIATGARWWGEGFRELFGDGPEDRLDAERAWQERVHPDDRERVLAGRTVAIARGDPAWHDEYRFRHVSGDYRWVTDRAHVIRDPHGRALRMIGGMTDVDQQRATEGQRHLLAAALESAPTPVVITDAEARILWVNNALCTATGNSREELAGRRATSLFFHDPDNPGRGADAWETLREGRPWAGELIASRKDGAVFPVHITVTPVPDMHGGPQHFVALAHDLTDKRVEELEALRAQRVESIGLLASGIAHDLNNVLAPIMLSVELLREDERDPDRLEALGAMESGTRRGAELLRQLLRFARGVDGRRTRVDPTSVLREIARLLGATFPRDITLRKHLPPANRSVLMDATQLHQVVMNLCVNARDAMPEGGTLTMALSEQTIDAVYAEMHLAATPGDYVVIEVGDTGSGMSPAVQSRIFERFFSTKPPGEGTGLGLWTTRAIVQSHGGFVAVTSREGEGSTFRVFLPVASDDASAEPGEHQPPALRRGEGELLLVVDDEAPIRQVASRTLELFGYRTISAEHGATAVALFARHRGEIAAVIVDMIMPVMDGPATIRALRTLDPHVPIIASSGMAIDSVSAVGAGIDVPHIVQKPYTASGLLTVVAEALLERRTDTLGAQAGRQGNGSG